ncbi:MAG: hypothetical protein JXB35_03265, partial [Anaerolineae bacterium]|nr:hypothetical protein [Anaerolineae bacterium]
WFLAALGGYGYVTRRWPLVAVAASAAVVQRETLPIAFGVLAGMDLVLRARRPLDSFYVKVLVVSGVAFGAYLALRLAIAPVSGYAGQLDPAAMAAHLRDRFPLDRALLLQGVFSQNLYFLMLFTTAGLWYTRRRLVWADTYVVQLTVVLLVLWVGGLAAGAGNNIGRLAAVLTPLQAVFSVYHGMCSEEAPGNYSKLSISRTP